MELQLREHQSKVIDDLREGFRRGHRSQLLYAPTGFGKTEVAIALMKATAEKYKRAAMVLDRIVLVDQTSMRLTKYGLSHGVMQAGHWKFNPMERLQVCSAQTLERRDDFPEMDLLIIDECFSGSTKISTPKGDVHIDNVRPGDIVLTQCGFGVVEAISARPATETFLLEFDDGTRTECTGNHPFFTSSGWKAARELEVGESFFSIQAVRLLWEKISSLDQEGRNGESQVSVPRGGMEQAISLFKILLKEIAEPDEQSSDSIEDERKDKGDQTQAYKAWRERALASFASISASSCSGGGMGSGGDSCNQDEASWYWLSNLLQNRHSQSKFDDRDRSGRGEPRIFGAAGEGQEKDRIPYFTRLVSVSCVQRESPIPVFNLQVSGHPSYFADGKLVHNCHITRAQTSAYIKANPELKVVGLTATPFTKGLGSLYSNVVCGATNNWLVDNKWLTQLRVFVAKEINMDGATKVAGEWSQQVATVRGMQITGDIVDEWIKKTHEVFGRPRKTIVFCSGVEHGADLVQQFAQRGYNFVSISYKDNDEFKRQAIEDFARPDTEIHGLIATDILTRGFDVSDVMIGVSARPFSKSFSSHVQQMGRVMRPHDGKDFALWLDHSGNYLRFKDDWDELYEEGVQELNKEEKAKKEPTEREKSESKCPACGWVWARNAFSCIACGHVRERKNQVSSVPGELQELGNTKNGDDRQGFYSELLYYAHLRNYNPNWAGHKYREKFGTWPRNLSSEMKYPSPATFKWVKSRQIAWAKRRGA